VIADPDAVCNVSANGHVSTNLPPPSANYECVGDKLHSGSMWLGISGLILTGLLMSRSFKGSIILGARPRSSKPFISPSPTTPEPQTLGPAHVSQLSSKSLE
jgi:xanthine/uracil/vitamin C permease (AzgA family)